MRVDQIARPAPEDVAQRGEHVQRQPFRGVHDEPVDLRGGQMDPTLREQRCELGRLPEPVLGHPLSQQPPVVHLLAHWSPLIPSTASPPATPPVVALSVAVLLVAVSTMRSSAERSTLVR